MVREVEGLGEAHAFWGFVNKTGKLQMVDSRDPDDPKQTQRGPFLTTTRLPWMVKALRRVRPIRAVRVYLVVEDD